ncbi:MAG TPA: energy transducer TonB [Allosphingosinicella sp.]|nr:energy transducer TonB [Allosphingosinicella sp.]
MRGRLRWALLRAVTVPLAAPVLLAASLAAAQTEVGTVNGWVIQDERGWCSASTVYDRNVYVRVSYDFGANSAALLVWNPAWESIRDGQAYDVTLEFSNGSDYSSTAARGVRAETTSGRITALRMSVNGDDFLQDFAGAAAVALMMGERRLDILSLRGTRAVAHRLQACATASFHRYPPDPFRTALPAPQTAQQPGGGARAPVYRSGTITNEDYPASALRANEQGTVTIRMSIGADGRVTGCTVVRSSGSTALDSTTCSLVQRRSRFTPAQDENGRPVAGTATRSVTWSLPEAVPSEPVTPPED